MTKPKMTSHWNISCLKTKMTASEDADDLIKIYRKIPTHLINVIEYNPVFGAEFIRYLGGSRNPTKSPITLPNTKSMFGSEEAGARILMLPAGNWQTKTKCLPELNFNKSPPFSKLN
jgi:hypothetical protein